MTKTNKLIVAGVVVLGAYYLYSKNKAKSEVADLKEGADLPDTTQEVAEVPKIATEVKATSIRLADDVGRKFSNFDGKRGNSYFETIF